MEFECDYDAPCFVDFNQLRQGFDDERADSWFDTHIEADGSDDSPDSVEEKTCLTSKPISPLMSPEMLIRKPLRHSKANKNAGTSESQDEEPGPSEASDSKREARKRKYQAKSTEELELEKIKELRKEARKKMKLSRRSFMNLSKTFEPVQIKNSRPPTETKEFKFSKEKPRASSQEEDSINPAKFPMTLRSSEKNKSSAKPPTPTLSVKPFKFELEKRFQGKNSKAAAGKVVTMAEAIENFHKKTPPRWRSKKASASTKGPVVATHHGYRHQLTQPKTPNLVTKNRSRPVRVVSAAKQEEEEVAMMKEHKFKAKPFNPKIFSEDSVYSGVRFCDKPDITEPESPPLATKERAAQRAVGEKSKREDEEEERESRQRETAFHARPMPTKIFEKVQGLPEKCLPRLTEPKSPALALKKRKIEQSESKEEKDDEEELCTTIKANPMPDFSKSHFKPSLPHKKTEVKPFSFETRYQDKLTRKSLVESILEKDKQKEAEEREFKATPLPDFDHTGLPEKVQRPCTDPKPFNFLSESFIEYNKSKLQEKIEQRERKEKEEREFKATEPSVIYKKPFAPQIDPKPFHDVSNINVVLHTDVRHKERLRFDEEMKKRDEEREQDTQERRAQKEAEENEEIKELRKKLVYKAKPVHKYAPMAILASDALPTVPLTPVSHTQSRLRGAKNSDVQS